MAMAAAEPSPAAVMTWARGLTAFPAAQTPGTLVRPVASTATQPLSCGGAAEAGEQVVVGHEAGADEHRGAGHDLAGRELDPGEPVVLDDQAGDRAVDDADGAGDELFALVGGQRWRRWRRTRRRRTTARTRWAWATRLGGAAEHAEGLVADLVAVAVRAVQQVAAPALAHPGDVGDLVAQPGGDQDAPGAQRRPVLEGDLEPRGRRRRCRVRRVMPVTRAGTQLAAVAGDLVAAGGQQLGGRRGRRSPGSPACGRPGRCAAARRRPRRPGGGRGSGPGLRTGRRRRRRPPPRRTSFMSTRVAARPVPERQRLLPFPGTARCNGP